MRTTLVATIVFSLAVFSQQGQAEQKLRVLDKGIDGNQRSYLVTCPDGTITSVIQTFNIPTTQPQTPPNHDLHLTRGNRAIQPKVTQVCIQPRQGDDVCRSSWDVDEAARASCR